ncbi:PHOT2 [Symbiodinium pilosum]|uniref:PHOT2 protein n=1 Tax=Symbiodinium pilosum TaxID=2952 RepID=A0A812WJH0_SYMPI|nr:PHOT2 [Symbiodinium pilosum]
MCQSSARGQHCGSSACSNLRHHKPHLSRISSFCDACCTAQPDCPLISVSEGFCELTGYDRETILGQNCRFLNDGCDIQPSDRQGLRVSAQTGKHFCGVLKNLKADGTPFLNLLDMRGLSVGKTKDGEERFFIVGIQADVSEQGSEDLPLEHKTQMQHIAALVRDELTSGLQQEAIVTASSAGDDALNDITPYEEPRWILGEVFETHALGG